MLLLLMKCRPSNGNVLMVAAGVAVVVVLEVADCLKYTLTINGLKILHFSDPAQYVTTLSHAEHLRKKK